MNVMIDIPTILIDIFILRRFRFNQKRFLDEVPGLSFLLFHSKRKRSYCNVPRKNCFTILKIIKFNINLIIFVSQF